MNFLYRAIVALVLCKLTTAQQPPQVEVLTLDQAVSEALENNLDLLAERYNVSIAEARIITAKLRPNPVLTLDADHLDLLGTGFNLATNNGGPQEYSIRTDFLFERGGKRRARIAVAEGNKAVARLQLLNTIRGTVLNVQNSFVDLLAAKANLKLSEQNLATLNEVVRINEIRVKNQDLAEVELLRAQVAALQFENQVRQAQVAVATARAKLQVTLGRTRNSRPVDVTGELRREPILLDEPELQEQARQMRPDLQAVHRDQARSRAEVRLQLAHGTLDYTLGTEYRRQSVTAHANTLGFFFQTNLPIFNRNQGEIERAKLETRQAEARIRALEAAVQNDVQIAYLIYSGARATLEKIETTMLSRARDVRGILEYSYKRGEAGFVDFLDAQRAYNETVQTYNGARADFARALYAIDAATGASIAGRAAGSQP